MDGLDRRLLHIGSSSTKRLEAVKSQRPLLKPTLRQVPLPSNAVIFCPVVVRHFQGRSTKSEVNSRRLFDSVKVLSFCKFCVVLLKNNQPPSFP